jgi:hypothetical protein
MLLVKAVNLRCDRISYVLGQRESNIRKNSAARTTDLLKQVFGRQVDP